MAELVLEKIGKVYANKVRAVSDVNLSIGDKEFVILVGPSGCGKTTTLRMIAGLEEISEGSLYLDGARINDLQPKSRDMAMVFQNYALYPHMTVFKNMAFSLQMAKRPKAEIKRKVDEAAKVLGLEDMLSRKPKELSGGQRQRVALGRAIVRNPKVFLLDEPLSNLDAKLRTQMRMELMQLHQRLGTTFIYVTHDQMEAMTMGTRIVVMKDGVVQQVDEPQKIYDHPRNVFVATFIGAPTINLLDGDLTAEGGELSVQLSGMKLKLPASLKERMSHSDNAQRKVKIGIRPEDICLYTDQLGDATVRIDTQVVLSEHMGSETHVHVSYLNNTLTMKIPNKFAFAPGETLPAAIMSDRIHIFDAGTEENLLA